MLSNSSNLILTKATNAIAIPVNVPKKTSLQLLQQFAFDHYSTNPTPLSLLAGLLQISSKTNNIQEFSKLSEEINKDLKPSDHKSDLTQLNTTSVAKNDNAQNKQQADLKVKSYIERLQKLKIKNNYINEIMNIFWSHYPELSSVTFKIDTSWPAEYLKYFMARKPAGYSTVSPENHTELFKFYPYLSSEKKNKYLNLCLTIIETNDISKINILPAVFPELTDEDKKTILQHITKLSNEDNQAYLLNVIARFFQHFPALLKPIFANILIQQIFNERLKYLKNNPSEKHEKFPDNYYKFIHINNILPQLFDYLSTENKKIILDILIARIEPSYQNYPEHYEHIVKAYIYLSKLFSKVTPDYQEQIATIFLNININKSNLTLTYDRSNGTPTIYTILKAFNRIIPNLSIEMLYQAATLLNTIKTGYYNDDFHNNPKRISYQIVLKTLLNITTQLKSKGSNFTISTLQIDMAPQTLHNVLTFWAHLSISQKEQLISPCINDEPSLLQIQIMVDYFPQAQERTKDAIRTALINLKKNKEHYFTSAFYTALTSIYPHDTEAGKQVIIQQILESEHGLGHKKFHPIFAMCDETTKDILFINYSNKLISNKYKRSELSNETITLFSVKQQMILMRQLILSLNTTKAFLENHVHIPRIMTEFYIEKENLHDTHTLTVTHASHTSSLSRLICNYLTTKYDEINHTHPFMSLKQTGNIMLFSTNEKRKIKDEKEATADTMNTAPNKKRNKTNPSSNS